MPTSNKKQYSTSVPNSHRDFSDLIHAIAQYQKAVKEKNIAYERLANMLCKEYGDVTSYEIHARTDFSSASVRMIRIRKGGDKRA